MKFSEYFKPLTHEQKKKMADDLDVSLGYLYRLAGEFSCASRKLAKKIQRRTKGAVTVQDW